MQDAIQALLNLAAQIENNGFEGMEPIVLATLLGDIAKDLEFCSFSEWRQSCSRISRDGSDVIVSYRGLEYRLEPMEASNIADAINSAIRGAYVAAKHNQ